MKNTRPVFPKRAVVTAGMPYGNKALHFGHIGGVFIQADAYARFLKDRIGEENVIFVSGTDCYGSMILTDHMRLTEEGAFTGTLDDFVRHNHNLQKEALDKYQVSPSLFGASSFGEGAEVHKEISRWIFNALYKKGYLSKMNTMQFYDAEHGVFLNGRQVKGQCPIQDCQSESAYADECSLGHQYSPSELINPVSVLSGKKPDMREAANWYFRLDKFDKLLEDWVESVNGRDTTRPYLLTCVREFLKPPVIYIKRSFKAAYDEVLPELPPHETHDDQSKASFVLTFSCLAEREIACDKLTARGIHYRTGKTLVPFRLTANTEWGIKAPEAEGLSGLTFWVWPESLWAPISFTQAVLRERGLPDNAWKSWWCSSEAQVYQIIGEDNIYFYGPAEIAMFMATNDESPTICPSDGQLKPPVIIPNRHLLFLNKKVSSSSAVKPPMAMDLLNFYTPEQLRAHFLGLGLGLKSANLQPKPLNPDAKENEPDPVLKEGSLLTNVFNRLLRSCFYSADKLTGLKIPGCAVSDEVVKQSNETILEYERLMYRFEFHAVMYLMDTYTRFANKHWVKNMKEADDADNMELRLKTLADGFHLVRVLTTLFHPIAPDATERICEYLRVSRDIFNWDHIFEPVHSFISDTENHRIQPLMPREDFFKKHDSQFGV